MVELWLVLTAIAAGAMNSIAGGGTLLTFPALVGVLGDEVAANVTNTVALAPGSIAGSWGYRKQFAACWHWVWILTAPSLIGGAIGSLLLILLPPGVFKMVVPWLVLLAAVLFLIQPRLMKWLKAHRPDGPPTGRTLAIILVCQLFIGIYGGYFGAGIGILMLTALGFLGIPDIHQTNALKTYLAFLINGVSVIFFIVAGQINWYYAIVMAIAAIVGGYVGARLSLRIKPIWVRWIVIVIGFSLAAWFFSKQMSSPGLSQE